MFNKTSLSLHVLIAAIAGFLMNYAIYQLTPINGCGTTEVLLECGTVNTIPQSINLSNPLAIKGEEIFEANCTQCHAINQQIVGPALKDVEKRWRNTKELAAFIKNPQKIIDSGKNPYATALFKKYKQYMPNHDFLSDEDVDALLTYIKAFSPSFNVVAQK